MSTCQTWIQWRLLPRFSTRLLSVHDKILAGGLEEATATREYLPMFTNHESGAFPACFCPSIFFLVLVLTVKPLIDLSTCSALLVTRSRIILTSSTHGNTRRLGVSVLKAASRHEIFYRLLFASNSECLLTYPGIRGFDPNAWKLNAFTSPSAAGVFLCQFQNPCCAFGPLPVVVPQFFMTSVCWVVFFHVLDF